MNHEVYADILKAIHDDKIRNFTIECLKLADPCLETIPTSVSGKYHPPECNGPGGLVKHVRRACHFARMFMDAYKIDGTNIKGDIIYSALLLHDIGKLGSYVGKGNAYVKHAQMAVEIVSKKKSMLPEAIYNSIAHAILWHMGSFSDPAIKKDMEKYTFIQLIVYNSDYFASRKDIHLDLKK